MSASLSLSLHKLDLQSNRGQEPVKKQDTTFPATAQYHSLSPALILVRVLGGGYKNPASDLGGGD